MPKTSIRREMLAFRKQMPAAECLTRSLQVQQRFIDLPEFDAAKVVALYSPFRNEVFTEKIFGVSRHRGKIVAFPRVGANALEFIEVSGLSDLAAGAFGILEPTGGRTVPLEDIDLMAVPGLAFCLDGYRLGYGQGFYDRILHGVSRRSTLAGLCFEQQILSELPVEGHDIPMDLIVTEARTHRCARLPVFS